MSLLRTRIREQSRFTVFDIDPVTAEQWGEALLRLGARPAAGVSATVTDEPAGPHDRHRLRARRPRPAARPPAGAGRCTGPRAALAGRAARRGHPPAQRLGRRRTARAAVGPHAADAARAARAGRRAAALAGAELQVADRHAARGRAARARTAALRHALRAWWRPTTVPTRAPSCCRGCRVAGAGRAMPADLRPPPGGRVAAAAGLQPDARRPHAADSLRMLEAGLGGQRRWAAACSFRTDPRRRSAA